MISQAIFGGNMVEILYLIVVNLTYFIFFTVVIHRIGNTADNLHISVIITLPKDFLLSLLFLDTYSSCSDRSQTIFILFAITNISVY